MEQRQVQLRLVSKGFEFETEHGNVITGDQILKQMKTNGVFKTDRNKEQYVPVLYNAMSFDFRAGKVIQVDAKIARALQRSATIIVGPKALNSPACPYLEVVREFNYGEQVETKAQYACPICEVDMETAPRLTRHLMQKHKEQTLDVKEENDWTPPASKPVEEEEV